MQLNENIYRLRKKNGLSQEKLAEKVNVSRQTISNWELGATSPNPEQLILLSREFGVSIDELVGNDIDETEKSKIFNYNLSLPLSVIFGLTAGIISFAANRFRNDEIFFIAVCGVAIGRCLGIICERILKNKK